MWWAAEMPNSKRVERGEGAMGNGAGHQCSGTERKDKNNHNALTIPNKPRAQEKTLKILWGQVHINIGQA